MTNPLVALGPDSIDQLVNGGENTQPTPPQVVTDADSKPRATEGAGSPACVPIPYAAMAATDAAVVRGDRAAIVIALAAERREWLEYGYEMDKCGIQRVVDLLEKRS